MDNVFYLMVHGDNQNTVPVPLIQCIIQGDFQPFTYICPENQKFWFYFSCQNFIQLFQWHKHKPVRIMIPVFIILHIHLYGCNLILSHGIVHTGTRRKWTYPVFLFTQWFKIIISGYSMQKQQTECPNILYFQKPPRDSYPMHICTSFQQLIYRQPLVPSLPLIHRPAPVCLFYTSLQD